MFYTYHYVNYMEILLQPFILERAYKKYGKREGLSPLHISFTNLNRMLFFTLIFISFIVNSHISMWYYTKMDQNWNKKFLQTLYVSNRKKNRTPKPQNLDKLIKPRMISASRNWNTAHGVAKLEIWLSVYLWKCYLQASEKAVCACDRLLEELVLCKRLQCIRCCSQKEDTSTFIITRRTVGTAGIRTNWWAEGFK